MKKSKGFTLAELLIVVAIIAVLVAIAIPIFGTQLEKAREALDAANIRSAYAEVMTSAITNDSGATKEVTLTQKQAGWQNTFEFPANLTPGSTAISGSGSQVATLTYTASTAATAEGSIAIDVVLTPAS